MKKKMLKNPLNSISQEYVTYRDTKRTNSSFRIKYEWRRKTPIKEQPVDKTKT